MDREMALSMDGYPPVIAAGQLLGAIEAAAAGLVIGLVGGLASRTHPLRAALLCGCVGSGTAATVIVLVQRQRGRWPVGTIDGRMIVAIVALAVLVCSAALLAATAKSASHRRTV
jgi:hypothetical protein